MRHNKQDRRNSSMRIVFICSTGTSEYWINLANAISKKCDLHLFLPSSLRNPKMSLYLENSVNVHYFEKFKFFDVRNIVSLIRLYGEILRLSPSLIHLPGGTPFGLPMIYPLTKMRYPLIITIHEPNPSITPLKYVDSDTNVVVQSPYSPLELIYERLLLQIHMRMADAVIVAGKSVERVAAQYWKSRKCRIFTVPFGAFIHYTKLIKLPVQEEETTVLFFGTIRPGKGLGYLIKAEPSISRKIKGLKIIIAGRGSATARGIYRGMIRNSQHFEIYDHFLEDEQLCELFQRASIVVLPYYGPQSQSGVVFTAYAFLKPVVITNVGSLPEAVTHGETGLVIPQHSVEALSNAIITLLKDEKTRKRMKKTINKRISSEQSWNTIAENMLAVYQRALECE